MAVAKVFKVYIKEHNVGISNGKNKEVIMVKLCSQNKDFDVFKGEIFKRFPELSNQPLKYYYPGRRIEYSKLKKTKIFVVFVVTSVTITTTLLNFIAIIFVLFFRWTRFC